MKDKIIQIFVDHGSEGYVWGLSESGKLYRMIVTKDKTYWSLDLESPELVK